MDINTQYELLTKEIFETLLRDNGATINVQHNVEIQGKAFKHQIDVYWEYQIAGIIHKVAIECKNYDSNVSVAKIRDFYGVLSDIGNVNGIMVSKNGFQKGAKEFAEYYGINLRELREPTDQDWKGRLKTIQINMNIVMPQVKSRKFNIDEKWVKENIELPKSGDFSYKISGMANEIWIVDGNGNQIKNMYQLDNELPHNWEKEEDIQHTYKFEDGYLVVEKYGKIKLNSIEYVYDVLKGEQKPLIIDGTASAKAILKDAITGEIKFFNKDGTIK
jgi:restriction endonuclease